VGGREDFEQLVALQEVLVLDQVEEFWPRGKFIEEHCEHFYI